MSTVKSVAVVEWNLYLLCEGAHAGSLAEAPHFVPRKEPLTMPIPKVRAPRACMAHTGCDCLWICVCLCLCLCYYLSKLYSSSSRA